jgi:hypothetical protein
LPVERIFCYPVRRAKPWTLARNPGGRHAEDHQLPLVRRSGRRGRATDPGRARADRVFKAVTKMKKLDLATLKAAYKKR